VCVWAGRSKVIVTLVTLAREGTNCVHTCCVPLPLPPCCWCSPFPSTPSPSSTPHAYHCACLAVMQRQWAPRATRSAQPHIRLARSQLPRGASTAVHISHTFSPSPLPGTSKTTNNNIIIAQQTPVEGELYRHYSQPTPGALSRVRSRRQKSAVVNVFEQRRMP
jgi:hypothetical protein